MAARSKFAPEVTAVIVSHLRAGGSLTDACRDVGVRLKTVETWLTRGRREEDGPYAEFAAKVELARELADAAGLGAEEFERHLARAVRKGSVQAMKLWWDIHGAKGEGDDADGNPADPFEALEHDELAARRKRQTS